MTSLWLIWLVEPRIWVTKVENSSPGSKSLKIGLQIVWNMHKNISKICKGNRPFPDRFSGPWIQTLKYRPIRGSMDPFIQILKYRTIWRSMNPCINFLNTDPFSGPWFPVSQFKNTDRFGGPWIPASKFKKTDQFGGPCILESQF